MEPIFAVDTTLFGAIAAFSTLLGIAMGVLSHISGRKDAAEKGAKECHDNLLAEQRVSERLSKELHDLRMKHNEAEQ